MAMQFTAQHQQTLSMHSIHNLFCYKTTHKNTFFSIRNGSRFAFRSQFALSLWSNVYNIRHINCVMRNTLTFTAQNKLTMGRILEQ